MPRISRERVEFLLSKRCADNGHLDIFAVEYLAVIFGYREEFIKQVLAICSDNASGPGSLSSLEDAQQIVEYCGDNWETGKGLKVLSGLKEKLDDLRRGLDTREQEILRTLISQSAWSKSGVFPVLIPDLQQEHPDANLESVLEKMEQRGVVQRNAAESDRWELRVPIYAYLEADGEL